MGLEQVPAGYEVRHIIPLGEGGTDEIENMQLLTVEEHRKKN
jgi:5-methylcytosine-specific restriction endonuclease McrA